MSSSTLVPAEAYGDQSRYNISSAKLIKFHPPPTPSYKIATTVSSVGVKGTLVELLPTDIPSSNGLLEWDTYANQPLYAARYENPLVSHESRTIYWEVELNSYDDEEYEKGKLDVDGELLMGFCAKDNTCIDSMRSAAAGGVDPRLHGASEDRVKVGRSILVNITTGEAFADGVKVPTQRPLPRDARNVGVGITFAFNAEDIPPEEEKEKKNVLKRWVDKHTTPPVPQASPEDLRPVPIAVFVAVDGECIGVDISNVNMVGLGFDGTRDAFPALVVRGSGVDAKLKFGECVDWTGAGGSEDARAKGLGNRAKPGFKEPTWPFRSSDAFGWWAMG